MKKYIIMCVVFVLFLVATGYGAEVVKAPGFTGKDIHGQELSTARFLGKQPALFMFWATW